MTMSQNDMQALAHQMLCQIIAMGMVLAKASHLTEDKLEALVTHVTTEVFRKYGQDRPSEIHRTRAGLVAYTTSIAQAWVKQDQERELRHRVEAGTRQVVGRVGQVGGVVAGLGVLVGQNLIRGAKEMRKLKIQSPIARK